MVENFVSGHRRYRDEDCEYVILNDDVDMLLCQTNNFIHVDSYKALTEEDIENTIDILERRNLE